MNFLPETCFISYFHTGSNYICNPPVENTDIDYMYYVNDLDECIAYLKTNGWKVCGGEEYNVDMWIAFRKEKDNVILTDSIVHYNKFEAAKELAKKRNLLNKEDRIELFRQICTF